MNDSPGPDFGEKLIMTRMLLSASELLVTHYMRCTDEARGPKAEQ